VPSTSIDFDRLTQWMEIPATARMLLERPERQVILTLSIRGASGGLVMAECFVVYHNTARGPAKGGIRIAPDVSLDETRDLAERMVWKTALVKIPFGGGKSGIAIDSKQLSAFERAEMIREYVHLMESDLMNGVYIPAPDLGSRPADMATIYGQTHLLTSVTGKPPRVGGLPGRKEATGRGVAHAAKLALRHLFKRDVSGTTVAVQGFGNVGSWAARFLRDMGAKIVAVSDITGGRYNPAGFDVDELMRRTGEDGILPDDTPGDRVGNDELLALDVDVLVPAAVGSVLTEVTAPTVKAKLVVEGANGPTSPEGDRVLERAGVVSIPDILANSGGVIASYIEWRNAKSGSVTDRAEVFESLESVLDKAFHEVADVARRNKISFRRAAECVAVDEVTGAMQDRGWV
jgi:glutamate dehydrogenase (NAD(P)+)